MIRELLRDAGYAWDLALVVMLAAAFAALGAFAISYCNGRKNES